MHDEISQSVFWHWHVGENKDELANQWRKITVSPDLEGIITYLAGRPTLCLTAS